MVRSHKCHIEEGTTKTGQFGGGCGGGYECSLWRRVAYGVYNRLEVLV